MKKISLFLCIIWMGFIFYMSSNIGQISQQQSMKVTNYYQQVKGDLSSSSKNVTANSGTQKPQNTTDKAKLKVQQTQKQALDHIIRKNAHAFEYIVLAILVTFALFSYNKKGYGAIVYILFICLFYAVTDEYHQMFVPGRGSLVSDILIDFLGVIIGTGIFYFVYYKIINKKRLVF